MTNLYTDEQRERIAAQMPAVWEAALNKTWGASTSSPPSRQEYTRWTPIRSLWLFSAMCMVEMHAEQFHHKLQSEVVYHLIAALICDEWASRTRELRHAERKLEAWRDTLRKEES